MPMGIDLAVDRKRGRADLAAFLGAHPWDESLLKGRTPIEYFSVYRFDASPEELWPILSDTSGINLKMGLNRIDFSERAGKRFGRSILGGRLHVWEERPWQWEYGKSISIERIYSSGWCTYVRVFIEFSPSSDGGTELTLNFGWLPRDPFSALVLKAAGNAFMRRYGLSIGTLLEERKSASALSAEQKTFPRTNRVLIEPLNLQRAEAALDPVAAARITQMEAELRSRELSNSAIDALLKHLRIAPAPDLHRMRPKALAPALGVGYEELLDLMLNATSAGLLTMSWDVICPHCRGVRQSAEHLWDVPKAGSCEVCRIDFSTSDLNSLEIVFRPHPDIRKTEEVLYCTSEPAKKSHILVQKELPPGDDAEIALDFPPGAYRLREAGRTAYALLRLEPDAEPTDIFVERIEAGAAFDTGTGAKLRLRNAGAAPSSFVLEKNKEDTEALRPRDLFGRQEFRDLFSKEALSPDLSVDVGVQVIVFVDIVGSSAMYVREGNARSFALVKNFYRSARDIAAKRGGALVKSLGDAVMLAFSNPLSALKAGADFIRNFDGSSEEAPFSVRVTVNAGPCLAVNLNSAIDYFGSPVNATAKLQKFAGAGHLAVTTPIVGDAAVRAFLSERNIALGQPQSADLPGIGNVDYWILKVKKR